MKKGLILALIAVSLLPLVGGNARLGTRLGDSVMAFALPGRGN